jgi:urease beta subunit
MNMKPGEDFLDTTAGPIGANAGRKTLRLLIKNTGDRPIQVGSHYHFFETNASLSFDRAAAYGMRLNIASGTAIRFEPGEEKEVELTNFAGSRIVHGFNGLVAGPLDDANARANAIDQAHKAGFASSSKGNNE